MFSGQLLTAELSLIDIIIGLVILYSLLAPLFQKKKKQQKLEQMQKMQQQEAADFGRDTEATVSEHETHPYGSKHGKHYSSSSIDDDAEQSGRPYGSVQRDGNPMDSFFASFEKSTEKAKNDMDDMADSIGDFFKLDSERDTKSRVRKPYNERLKEEKRRGTLSSAEKDFVAKQRELMEAADDISLDDLPPLKTDEDFYNTDNYQAHHAVSSRADEIRDIISKPRDLGTYIIISEILDKPKALRRFY